MDNFLDVCEYDTDQIQLQNPTKSYQENNAKEFENSAVLLDSNNLSEKNLDIISTLSETNIDIVNMSRSENFANIHEQKEIYSENEKSKNALNDTKLTDKKNNELVVSYGTQTSKQVNNYIKIIKTYFRVILFFPEIVSQNVFNVNY